MIEKWKNLLSLKKWTVITESIDTNAVTYDNDCPDKDRYFIGIEADHHDGIATIYHDRPLTDEYIVHELLHVKYPDWSEDQVNAETEKILNQNKDEYNIRNNN